jgi:predicted metal-dependent HD superfamily phosphohydrolase
MLKGLRHITIAPEFAQILNNHYSGRAYHNIRHIQEVLDQYRSVPVESWQHPLEVELAILFHDMRYEAGEKNNEEISALWAGEYILQFFATLNVDVGIVKSLIRLTSQHGRLSSAVLSEDARLFLDCDMAILGSNSDRFEEYNREIAEEYSFVEPKVFEEGRYHFFDTLPKPLFLSEFFQNKLEQQARNNVERWLAAQ